MPRKRRSSSPSDSFDEDFDEETSSTSSRSGQPPIQRNAANARERARMRVLSSAFCRLKTKLPNIPADTKLSKLDTLRLATIYIQQLKSIVDGEQIDDTMTSCSHHQQNLTWPFTFQQISNNYRQPTPVHYNEWNHHQKLPDIYNHNNNNNNNTNNNHLHNNQMIHSSIYDNGGHQHMQ